jgi:hydroxyacylglutathione hydrolase
MELEDHAGDIVRKARARTGVSINVAAEVAGLTPARFGEFEANGIWPGAANLAAVAQRVQLDAAKLAAIVGGWQPRVPDLKRWQSLRVITSARGAFTVNAYLAWDEAAREAVVFDTGFDAYAILQVLMWEQLTLRAICITHSHPDHVACLGELHAAHPAAVVYAGGPVTAGVKRPDTPFAVGDLSIAARATPGHADDGVTYIITGWPGDAPAVAVVGDTLFAGSVGKAEDSWPLALGKVREEILSLPGETLLCPGHGPLTTVEQERAHNPFF